MRIVLDGDPYLAASEDTDAGTLTVARPIEEVDAATSTASVLLAIAVPLLLIVIGAVMWIVATRALAPVERMPSTGCGSIASTASAKSLASTPAVWIHNASTPANGPRPTATTKSMANTISLMARQASISRRMGW